MGNSCFRSDRPHKNNKIPKESHENPSILDLKIWRQQLGFQTKKQTIIFDYPSNVIHKTFKNIEKDITRTYPSLTFFGQNKINLEIFEAALKKLAVYFPRTGYTQGMNFVVGFFLLSGLNVNQTFTMCVKIFTNYQLFCLGLYQDYFPLNKLYCALVWEVVNNRALYIKEKLNNFNIIDELWLFQWFTTFFIYSLPFEIIPQLWTFIFVHKQFAFVRIASAIIIMMGPYIKKCEFDIDFINLTNQIKKIEVFNKYFTIQQVLQNATAITNEEIVSLLPKTEMESKNKYCAFFCMAQNDRKIKYLEMLSQLSEQRHEFIKNPTEYKFNRAQNQISVIDSIETNQAKMMHHSYSFHRPSLPMSPDLYEQRLWRSDLHKLPYLSPLEKQQPKQRPLNDNILTEVSLKKTSSNEDKRENKDS